MELSKENKIFLEQWTNETNKDNELELECVLKGNITRIDFMKVLNECREKYKLIDEKREDRLLRIKVANRLKVRKYVELKDKSIEFPKLIWKGTKFSYLDYAKLPNKFYLKHNSSSGKNKIIDKTKYSLKDINNWIKKSNIINMDGLQENGIIQEKITIFVKNQYLKKNLQIIVIKFRNVSTR